MNASADRAKKIDSMLDQLREMNKRGVARLKKEETQLKEAEQKYQRELADFKKKYGE